MPGAIGTPTTELTIEGPGGKDGMMSSAWCDAKLLAESTGAGPVASGKGGPLRESGHSKLQRWP